MMPKRLIVTVGTSLFYSASWTSEGRFAEITDYEKWLDPRRRDDPLARKAWSGGATGSHIESEIAQLLIDDPKNAELVEKFDPSFNERGRYSAEISTLIAMRQRLDQYNDFTTFLKKYRSIVLLHGGGDRNPAAAAALHLVAALGKHAKVSAEARALEGGSIQDVLKSLVRYLQSLDNEPTDLVATGGYKAFTVALSHIYWQRANLGWRLFYLHESDMGDLVQEWGDGQEHRVRIANGEFSYRRGPTL